MTDQPPAPTPEPATAPASERPHEGLRLVRGLLLFTGVVLLLVAVGAEVAAVFPSQGSGPQGGLGTIGDVGSLVAIQVVLAGGFFAAALLVGFALVAGRPAPARAGAFLAIGIAAGTAGLVLSTFATDLQVVSGSWGLWLQAVALVAAALGAIVTLAGSRAASRWRPFAAKRPDAATVALTAVAAAVLGYALLPSWDRYRTVSTVTGRVIVSESGSVFARHAPGGLLAATALASVAFFVVPLLAAQTRSSRLALFAAGGIVVAVASQCVSAFVAAIETKPTTPGWSAGAVALYGLHVDGSLTPWFDAEVVAAVAVLALCVARWWTGDGEPGWGTSPVTGGGPATAFALYGSTAAGPVPWSGAVAMPPPPSTAPPRPHG